MCIRDSYKTTENTALWRPEYQKPVVVDECAYEGNINHCWGNITPQEMTRRFWEGVLRGGYVSHGETYVHPRDILWWSHGGELHGESPARIAFLRRLVESLPAPLSPAEEPVWSTDYYWDMTCGAVSYTHLDVYKRQGPCRPRAGTSAHRPRPTSS